MKPTPFQQVNFTWKGDDKDVDDLPAHLNGDTGVSTSCWEVSPEDLEEIKRTGKVWLQVLGQHPAVLLRATDPFEPEE